MRDALKRGMCYKQDVRVSLREYGSFMCCVFTDSAKSDLRDMNICDTLTNITWVSLPSFIIF